MVGLDNLSTLIEVKGRSDPGQSAVLQKGDAFILEHSYFVQF